MKTALVCIAKDEDHYIDEWLKYHAKLGFDMIYVYLNNWRYVGDKTLHSNVKWIEFDGEAMLMNAYNDFINNHHTEYDWAAFYDVDEFLCLKEHSNVKDFLTRYDNFYAVGVNWRCFGDNGLIEVKDNDYSLLNRFTRCEDKLNKHIKTILNLKKTKNYVHFVNPHFVDAAVGYDITIDVNMTKMIHGPFNDNAKIGIALLNHYHAKTMQEFKEIKLCRGKADTRLSHPMYNYKESDFFLHNNNDVEDLTAKEFYNK